MMMPPEAGVDFWQHLVTPGPIPGAGAPVVWFTPDVQTQAAQEVIATHPLPSEETDDSEVEEFWMGSTILAISLLGAIFWTLLQILHHLRVGGLRVTFNSTPPF